MGTGLLGGEEEEVVPRSMERTLCSLLGGAGVGVAVVVGVAVCSKGLDDSGNRSAPLACCCLTSRRDCPAEAE